MHCNLHCTTYLRTVESQPTRNDRSVKDMGSTYAVKAIDSVKSENVAWLAVDIEEGS